MHAAHINDEFKLFEYISKQFYYYPNEYICSKQIEVIMKNLNLNSVSKSVKKLSKLMVVPMVLLLGACSTTYTPETDKSSTYDFASVKSYHVIGDQQLKNPMFSDIDRNRLETAIDDQMKQRGKLEVEQSKADILVSYFIVTKDKVKVNTSSSGGYYGHGCYRCGYGYGVGVTHVSTRDYVEGTLVVDIIDNDSQQSVYRSVLTKPIKSFDTAQEREQAINKMVSDMIKPLPVS